MTAATPTWTKPKHKTRIFPHQRAYRPAGAAQSLMYCRDTEVLVEGPAGTGKTRALLEKANLCALKYPGSRILLLRKTRESMSESVLVTFEQQVIPEGWPLLDGRARQTRSSYRYPNGSTLVIAGMDRNSRIMSTEFDLVFAFEARELSEDDWEALLSRLRHGVLPYQQAVADTNPDAPTHWLNRRAAAGRMTRLRSRHADNPAVTPAYLAQLDRLTGVRRRRLALGQWAGADHMVYDLWDPAMHLVEARDIPSNWRRIRAIDLGYTNPFVCQWWAIDNDGRMILYRELYQTSRLVIDHAQQILALSAGESIEATVCDHDAEDRATLAHAGVPTIPASKSIAAGVQLVLSRLRPAGDGRPRLTVHQNACISRDAALRERSRPTSTAEEFESYVWQVDPAGAREIPRKVDDHGMDAMRYAVAYVDQLMGDCPLQVFTFGEEDRPANPWR